MVLLKYEDYTKCVEMLLTDLHEFVKRIDKDPTIMRLKTAQHYVNKLFNLGEIDEEQKKIMRPKQNRLLEFMDYVKTTSHFKTLLNFDQSLILRTHLITALENS